LRRRRPYANGPFQRELEAVYAIVGADDVLAAAQSGLPVIDREAYFWLVMTACVRGLIGSAPAGREAADVLADLGIDEHEGT
jgi:hypothetical protein